MNLRKRTQKVREAALRLGFDACGFAKAGRLETEERRLTEWLNQGRHGTMGWMENYFDKRVDPTKLVPGAQSVVSVIGSYYHPDHESQQNQTDKPKIAKYAQGRDYHKVYKSKLKTLFKETEELLGSELNGRVFVDSAPVLDKAWAVRAGLGWMGKNSNILNKNIGSFFFIGEMIIDAEFQYSTHNRPLRQLYPVYRCLPYQCYLRALSRRLYQVHLIPDHRIERSRSPKSSRRSGAMDVWLRHMPRCLPLE